MAASSSSSPCAACKFLRRKCTPECVFAPYFPPDQPHKFANVHKIFGASNITKLLNELPVHQREDAVNSLAYEADARVKDPVYGCVGAISMLQRQVARLQHELALAQQDLARYTASGSQVLIPQHHPGHPHPPPPPPPPTSPSPVQLHHHQHHQGLIHPGMNVSHGGMGIGHEIFAREHLTREQVMDIARIGGGSYETGLAVLGLNPVSLGGGGGGGGGGGPSPPVSAGQFVAPTPSSRTSGSDTSGGASSSSGGGGGGGGGGFYH